MKTTTTPEIHLNPIALAGFSSANSYDTHRPSYASDAVEHLLNSLGLADKPRSRILELAAGTGKFTELLACRNENFDIVAVEPHRDMLRVLSEKNFPAGAVVNVKEGNAVDIPVENEWADSFIVAQVGIVSVVSSRLSKYKNSPQPPSREFISWVVSLTSAFHIL
jgi:ubiquinone/menaquinone biosynthesis C-methylase UbiE